MVQIQEIISYLEELFPRKSAYEWDNVGLQIGLPTYKAKRVLLALDATTAVIQEATNNEIDLLITHHPFFYTPIKSIDFTTRQGMKIEEIIRTGLTVYSIHTNYDIAPGGMNDALAKAMGLQNISRFAMTDEENGLGRMGELTNEMSLEVFQNHLKKVFKLEHLTYVQGNDQPIKKVAVIGGSGRDFVHEAKEIGADVFVTGDMTYSAAIDAQEAGLNVIDVGHYAEKIMLEEVATLLINKFGEGIEVIISKASKNPIQLGN